MHKSTKEILVENSLYHKIQFATPYELITEIEGTFYYKVKHEGVK
jgi:hypothetical protein